MRKFSSEIILHIRSPEFYDHAYKEMSQLEPGPAMWRKLDETLGYSIDHYAHRVERELAYSEPLPGATVASQVRFYLRVFLQEYSREVIKAADEIPIYGVSDGLSSSRTDARLSPDATLRSWVDNPATSSVYRDDPMCNDGNSRGELIRGRDVHNDLGGTHGGVVFCDQSHIGQSAHLDFYENTAYKRALNKNPTTRFGVATPESDARLLSRRIFRDNEDGVENGIPKYHTRIHHRAIDRDVSETMRGGGEMMGFGGRYDMGSITRRINHKTAVANMSGVKYADRLYMGDYPK